MRSSGLCVALMLLPCFSAGAATVQYRRIEGQTDFTFKLTPSQPTVNDVISFFDPFISNVYPNSCEAILALGEPHLTVDVAQHRVTVFQGAVPPGPCPDVIDPVRGLEGNFGPLEAGNWIYQSIPRAIAEHPFTVVPEPGSIGLIGVTAVVALRRRRA